MGFLSRSELNKIGFKTIGENVSVSDKASIYNPELISIGSNVRIDDFCILSGNISLHDYIHISAYSALYGKFEIEMRSFTGLSPRTTIFSGSDDFTGEYMISPMVPEKLSNVTGGKVLLSEYTQIGSGSILMPNITLGEGTVLAAMSFLKINTEPWCVYAGCPAKYLKSRKQDIRKLSLTLRNED